MKPCQNRKAEYRDVWQIRVCHLQRILGLSCLGNVGTTFSGPDTICKPVH